MRHSIIVLVSLTTVVGFGVGWTAGCSGSTDGTVAPDSGPGSRECPACVTDTDCASGSVCAQFQGDTFCAQSCGSANACPSGRSCSIETTYNGKQVSVCIPDGNACGPSMAPMDAGCPPAPACDAGSSSDMCGSLVGPTVSSTCSSCGSSSSSCQPNGCYGGWWCDTSTSRCQMPPSTSTCPPPPSCPPAPPCPADSGGGKTHDSGAVTGTVTGSGGTLSALRFAVVGDTRPPSEDDTSGYPTAVIQRIFSDLQAASPSIPFAISTGDYMFANPRGSESAAQLSLYMAARGKYSGVTFPAMGNHECTGATASNCGSGGTDGITTNYTNFLATMLSPIGQTKPYYSIDIKATDGSWTSKFVFVAANAWDSTQASWLSSTLATSTTYTFVVRHESDSADTAPGVSPSQTIIASHPYTLLIVGHSHTYTWYGANEVVIGNGGAPLTGGVDYGYGLIQQASNGDISIDMVDYMSGASDSSFHRDLTAAGKSAP
jgi:hypothetical protein